MECKKREKNVGKIKKVAAGIFRISKVNKAAKSERKNKKRKRKKKEKWSERKKKPKKQGEYERKEKKKGVISAHIKDQSVWVVYPAHLSGYVKSRFFYFGNCHIFCLSFFPPPTENGGGEVFYLIKPSN